jgi:hypothetical protein
MSATMGAAVGMVSDQLPLRVSLHQLKSGLNNFHDGQYDPMTVANLNRPIYITSCTLLLTLPLLG